MTAPVSTQAVDDEGRVIGAIAKVVSEADTPVGAACACIRHSGNALARQFTRLWEGHEAAALEHQRNANYHFRQAARLMPVGRRAR